MAQISVLILYPDAIKSLNSNSKWGGACEGGKTSWWGRLCLVFGRLVYYCSFLLYVVGKKKVFPRMWEMGSYLLFYPARGFCRGYTLSCYLSLELQNFWPEFCFESLIMWWDREWQSPISSMQKIGYSISFLNGLCGGDEVPLRVWSLGISWSWMA